MRELRPFKEVVGRLFESFQDVPANPTEKFDHAKFQTWLDRHTKNILLHYPVFFFGNDEEDVFDDVDNDALYDD